MDYAYTLQGWLKGVNSSSLHEGLFDIGQDGKTGGSLPIVGRDAFGYMLVYYLGDYNPIGQQAFSLNTFTSPSPEPNTGFKSLYNGNIGGMVTNIRQLNTPQYTYYHYDQLNRIKRMEALHGQNAAANTWTFGLRFNGYIESFTYDPNGNIKTLSRNSNVAQIDDLTYNYLAGTNKLTGVTDPIASGLMNYDIDGQAANNYSYDRIGNMTADNAEGITNISWTVYGKIKNITKSTGTIEYRYDASGNRIYKKTFISGATTETYYARDAQGNVMAVYEKQAANPLKWMEQHLYGSSRLGMWNLADVVPATTIPATGGTVQDGYLYGSKFFELSNHLGNVLVTVSDMKIGIDDGGNGTIDYFQPEVLTAQDYYSFGMAMPGRKYTKPNSGYRYGFNGKENDNDVKGEGNQQDYGMRIYDPRLSKFLSVDPLTSAFPWYTPYQFAGNKPIKNIDLDGAEECGVDVALNRDIKNYLSGKIDEEQYRANINARGIGAIAGVGIVLTVVTAGEVLPLLYNLSIRAAIWGANPVNQQMVAGAGAFSVGFLNPDPNAGNYLPNTSFDEAGSSTRQLVKSVWRNVAGPVTRGKAFEYLGSITKYSDWQWVGKLDNGFFPTIDYVKNQIAVQFKTFSGKASSFDMSKFTKFVDDLAKAVDRGYVSGKTQTEIIKKGELDILVSEAYIKRKGESAFKAIWEKFEKLKEYGQSKGIDVNIDYRLDRPQ
jgi:RHS repeat-associated protein